MSAVSSETYKNGDKIQKVSERTSEIIAQLIFVYQYVPDHLRGSKLYLFGTA